LVDIVITDENLHAVFLFNLKGNRPNGRGVWAWRTDRERCRGYTAFGGLQGAKNCAS
jgi:hypothetical protein